MSIGAYSPGTGKHYSSWDDLVAAESNGWIAVAIITDGKTSWPWSIGPFSTKGDATSASVRLRRYLNKESQENKNIKSFRVFVRPVWKEVS